MPKKITIEHLATMVSRGFDGVDKQFEEVAKKSDMDKCFNKVDERFDRVENRLGKIENILTSDYKRLIEKLELEMKELKNALAI